MSVIAQERSPLGDGPTFWDATCEKCGTAFVHPRSQGKRRFCSLTCSGNANTKVKLVCQWCGGDYVGRPQERRFCSRSCFYDHLTANAEGHITKNGYRLIYVDGQQTPEHRHVMKAMLGHELPDGCTVHHRDLNKLNNAPDNLELWASVHPKGARVLDLIDYARMIIETFSPDEARLRELEALAIAV